MNAKKLLVLFLLFICGIPFFEHSLFGASLLPIGRHALPWVVTNSLQDISIMVQCVDRNQNNYLIDYKGVRFANYQAFQVFVSSNVARFLRSAKTRTNILSSADVRLVFKTYYYPDNLVGRFEGLRFDGIVGKVGGFNTLSVGTINPRIGQVVFQAEGIRGITIKNGTNYVHLIVGTNGCVVVNHSLLESAESKVRVTTSSGESYYTPDGDLIMPPELVTVRPYGIRILTTSGSETTLEQTTNLVEWFPIMFYPWTGTNELWYPFQQQVFPNSFYRAYSE